MKCYCHQKLERFIHDIGIFYKPKTQGIGNFFNISQVRSTNFKQLIRADIVIEMNKPVSVSSQLRHEFKIARGNDLAPVQGLGDLFVFRDGIAKSLCSNVPSHIENGFQRSTQAGLCRPNLRVSPMKAVFEFRGKARISPIILSTQPRRSVITLFEIFPGTMLCFLKNHRHALTFQLRQVPCAAQHE